MDAIASPVSPRSERLLAFRLIPAVSLLLVVLAAAMHAYGGYLGPGENFLRGLVLPGVVLALSLVPTGPRHASAPGRPLLVTGVVFLMLAALWETLDGSVLFASVLSPARGGNVVESIGYLVGYFLALYGAVRRILLAFDVSEKEARLLDRLNRLAGSTSDAAGLAHGTVIELSRHFADVSVEIWRRNRELGLAERLGRRDPMRIGSEPPGEVCQPLGGEDGVSACFKTGEWQHVAAGPAPGAASEIVVPVLAGGELTAAIRLLSARPRRFSEGDLKLLLRVSGALGAGFFSSGLEERARRRREALEAFVREVDDVVLRVARGGAILALNERGAKLLGVRPQDLVGRMLLDLVPDEADRRQRMAARLEALEAGTPFDVELPLETPGPGGRRFDLRLRGVPFSVTEPSGEEGAELLVLARPATRAIAEPGTLVSRIAGTLRAPDAACDLGRTIESVRSDLARAIEFDEIRLFERSGDEVSLAARIRRDGGVPAPGPIPAGSLARAVLESAGPRWAGGAGGENGKAALLAVPVLTSGGVTGVLEIESEDGARAFGAEDAEFLSLVADLVASSIDRSRIRSERERLDVHQAVVASVGKAVHSMLEFAAVASAAARELHERFRYLGVAVDCVSPESGGLVRLAEAGAAAPRLGKDGGPASRAISTGRTLRVDEDDAPGGEPRSVIAAPIASGGEVVGVILAGSREPSRAAGPEVETLESVADLLGLAWMGARRGEELRHAGAALARSEAAAEEERRRLSAILQGLPDGVVVADAGHIVTLVNPAAEEILGVGRGDLLGRPLLERLTSGALRDIVLRGIASPHEIATGEVTIDRARGEPRVFSATVGTLPGPAEERRGFVLVLRDASSARALARMKDNFLSGVSHELRTPLTSIIGFSQMLLDGGVGDLAADQLDCVHRVYRQGRHLLGLIDALLDLARFGSGSIERTEGEFDAREIARKAAESHREAAEARGLTLRVETPSDPVPCAGDRGRIAQALSYLIDNGIKFSRDDGEVRVRVCARRNRVRLAVVDTGIGIPREAMRHLFSPLFQIDGGLDRRANGLGIGLALVREIASAHGGWVWVRSWPQRGSVFSLVLPQKAAPAATASIRVGTLPSFAAWPVDRAAILATLPIAAEPRESPEDVLSAVEGGAIDAGLLPLPLVLARRIEGTGPGLKAIAVCGRAGAAIVARRGRSVATVEVPSTLSSEAALARDAFSEPRPALVARPVREIVARFERGECEAAAVPEPFGAAMAAVEGVTIVRTAASAAPRRPLYVLAATEETIRRRASELRALVGALGRAAYEGEKNLSRLVGDVASALDVPLERAGAAMLEPAGRSKLLPLDVLPSDLADALAAAEAAGVRVPRGFDPASAVDRTFTSELAEEEGQEVAREAARRRDSGRSQGPRRTILVADDSAAIRRLVEMKLLADFDVVTASDGREAVRLARERRPDLVIMDVMMPGLDGIAATRILREDPATRDIPIIGLTARARRSDFDEMLRAGAMRFVTKPFYPGELRRTVDEALATRDGTGSVEPPAATA